MRKIVCFLAFGLTMAAVATIPENLVASGLRTQLGEVVIENLQIGQTYNLKELANLQLIVTNSGETQVDLLMEVLVPDTGELRQGAAAIPDSLWIALSQDSFKLGPNQNAISDIIVSIPDDAQYLGKKYQVNIWSHTLGGESMNVAVGLKSRIIFTTDTVKADVDQLSTRSNASVDFTMTPGEIYLDNVPLGKRYDIGKEAGMILTVTNHGEREQAFKLQSRAVGNSSATLTGNYSDTPDAAFLSFSESEFTLPPKGTTSVKMYLEFPAKEEYASKKFMFIIRAYSVSDKVSNWCLFAVVRVTPVESAGMRPDFRRIVILLIIGFSGALSGLVFLLPTVIGAQPSKISERFTPQTLSSTDLTKRRPTNSESEQIVQEVGSTISVTVTVTSLTAGELSLPDHFSLSQNYPNPFNSTTIIEYKLPSPTHVTVEIYNMLGQKVRTLVDDNISAGHYRVEWDGNMESGRTAATGVYLYRIQAGDFVRTKKMLLLR